jgi:RNA polymerase sigma factor (sigma-70 family)
MWVIPAASAFSLACGRLGWSLAEIECLTLHGRPQALLNAAVAPGGRLLILSHGSGTPIEVAKTLTALGYGASRMIVLERMGHAEERQLAATAADWKIDRTEDLNTIAIECVAGPDAVARPRVPGLPDDAFRHERGARVRAAIAQLPPKQRSTLILRIYHEMSHQEIADAMGSSVGAVKANFFHALGNLKKLLADQ